MRGERAVIDLVMLATTRLVRLSFLGLAALGFVRGLAACEDDSSSASPVAGGTDAGFVPSPTSTPPGPVTDGGTEAAADANLVTVADLTSDFSKTANPNGAWTFGYSLGVPGGDAGAFIAFSATSVIATNVTAWIDPTHQVLNDPCVYRNESGAVFADGVKDGEVALHPGNAGEYAIARWTAPSAGAYAVRVQFKEGDTGDTDGLVLHNGVVVATEASTSTNAVHELALTLAAGDRVDVAVGAKGDFLDDSTPVVFTVRAAGR